MYLAIPAPLLFQKLPNPTPTSAHTPESESTLVLHRSLSFLY